MLSRLGAPLVLAGERSDVDRWLAASDVFVLPSVWESRPLAAQEAMAAQVPVIATRTGGIPDLLEGAGLLFDVDDVAAMVSNVLHDPLRRNPGQEAHARRTGKNQYPTPVPRHRPDLDQQIPDGD